MMIHRISSRKPTYILCIFSENPIFNPFNAAQSPKKSGFLAQPSSSARRFSAFNQICTNLGQYMHRSTFPCHESEQKKNETQSKSVVMDENPTNASNDDENAPQDTQIIFRKMKETGLIPNAVAMLDGLCKDGLVQEAMKLFGEMRAKGSIPEVVVYTAVVEGFCKALKLEDAKRIFKKMLDNGIVPNAFSYGVLIQGLCKDKKLEDAVKYTLEMLDRGWKPNVATYTSLIDGFCKEQRLNEAKGAIDKFKTKGFVADERAVRDYMDKNGPLFPSVWEVMFGKRGPRRTF